MTKINLNKFNSLVLLILVSLVFTLAQQIQYRPQQVQYRAPQQFIQYSQLNDEGIQTATPVSDPEQNEDPSAVRSQLLGSQVPQQIYQSNVDRQVQAIQQQTYQSQLGRIQGAQPAYRLLQVPQTQTQGETQARYVAPIVAQHLQRNKIEPAARISYKNRQDISNNNEEKEDYDPNPSYQFGFDVNDDLNTNYQNRKEQRDGDKITGSYSVVDSDGFIRTVKYTADPKEGFKAEVVREPTDIVVKIPTPAPPGLTLRQQYIDEASNQIAARPSLKNQQQQQQQYYIRN